METEAMMKFIKEKEEKRQTQPSLDSLVGVVTFLPPVVHTETLDAIEKEVRQALEAEVERRVAQRLSALGVQRSWLRRFLNF